MTNREREDLSRKLEESRGLLKELEEFAPEHTAKRIKRLLVRSSALVFPPSRTLRRLRDIILTNAPRSNSQDPDSRYVSKEGSEDRGFTQGAIRTVNAEKPASSPSSMGSLEALDEVDEDVTLSEESRATGHFGKSSDIRWMQRLQKEAEQHSLGGEFDRPLSYALNYHLDDLDIGVSEPVQMYWIPPRPLADSLFQTYLEVAHPYLPLINRSLFCEQYGRFFGGFDAPGDKWMAILNVIFAIASSYAHTAQLDWRGDPRDHIFYLTRARMLSMSGDDLFRHPDLQ